MLKKGDIILVALVAAIVVLGFAGTYLYKSSTAGTGKVAVIKQNNNVIREIDLNKIKEPQRIQIDGDYTTVILAEDGRIRFEEANCPDLVCVKSGWLTENGDMAVCLPNRVSVKIEGTNDTVDGVTF